VSEKRIKDWFLSQSLDHPKRTTIITLLISILMGSGLQFFKIEDDMMKRFQRILKQGGSGKK